MFTGEQQWGPSLSVGFQVERHGQLQMACGFSGKSRAPQNHCVIWLSESSLVPLVAKPVAQVKVPLSQGLGPDLTLPHWDLPGLPPLCCDRHTGLTLVIHTTHHS